MKLKTLSRLNIKAIASVIATAAIASPSVHAEDYNWRDSTWYMGANIGESTAKINDGRITNDLLLTGLTTPSMDNKDHDRGFKLFGGYQFNQYFALEGGYFDLGKFDFRANTLPLGTLDARIKVKGINFDLVGFVPFTEKLSGFGRVGVSYAETQDSFRGTGAVTVLKSRTSDRAFNPKAGIGLQYDVNENWSMRLEGERYRINDAIGNKANVNLVSVGVIYRFGHQPAPVTPVVIEPARPPVVVVVPAPAPPPPPPQFVKYTLSANELFAFDSAEVILPQPQLDEIAKALKGEGAPQRIVITGYTDRLGSTGYNQKLSERRAIGVKNYLVSQGVDPDRLVATGRAEADPVVVCTDKNLQALIKCLTPNRRVEIDQMTIVKEIKK